MSEPLQLLLVDDDQVDRMAVRRLLRQAGVKAEVQEVADFQAAREALLRSSSDCVLLDFHLPGGDGLELMQQATAAGVEAPVIVLTGQGDETLAVDLMKAGAVDYLPKRLLTPDRLSQSIRQAIRVHQAEQSAQRAHDALQHQAAQLLLLSESSLGIHAAITIEETLELVTRLARDLIGTHLAAARVCRDGLPVWISQSRSEGATLPELTPTDLARWEKLVWREKKCVVLSEEALREAAEWNAQGRLKGVLAAPLTGRSGALIGTLLLTEPTALEFRPGDPLMLAQLAKAASVALESSRLYREAQEATRARDDVLAIVSHDLRSPLGVLGISAGVLRKALEGTPNAPVVQGIERNVRRMSRLIDDLLCASRIDAASLSVQPVKVNAGALIAEAVESVVPLAQEQGCTLQAEPVDRSLVVSADPERLMQVFWNLIGNALKYVPQGTGTVTLGVSREGPRACFWVKDNGPGIPAEALPHVFERCWKAQTSEADGAGLGLYIAKGIIAAHRGTISLDSEAGAGTTARFWLPLADA